MKKSEKHLVASLLALVAAIGCFALSRFIPLEIGKIIVFTVGAVFVLGFFVSLIYFLVEAFGSRLPGLFFNIIMLVVVFTFTVLYDYSPEITGFDFINNDTFETLVTFLLAFVFVVVCSVLAFRKLRPYADPYYTAWFAAIFATLSGIFYLFGPMLPEEDALETFRMFVVVGSLSLGISLVMIEADKRRKAPAPEKAGR